MVTNLAPQNAWGFTFTQLFEEMPWLARFYTAYEKDYETETFANPIQDSWPALPLGLSAVYLISIALGQRFMAKRRPLSLRYELTAWNSALALFSVCGALRYSNSPRQQPTHQTAPGHYASTLRLEPRP